jgi:hypothetical protein
MDTLIDPAPGAHSTILLLEEVLNYESVDSDQGVWDWRSNDYTVPPGPVLPVLEDKRYDEHFEELCRVLKAEGFTKPIRIHPEHKRVTDGHHRIAAAMDLGWKFVPFGYFKSCDEDSGSWGEEYEEDDDY